MSPLVVAAFYQFAELPDYRELRPAVLDVCTSNRIRWNFASC